MDPLDSFLTAFPDDFFNVDDTFPPESAFSAAAAATADFATATALPANATRFTAADFTREAHVAKASILMAASAAAMVFVGRGKVIDVFWSDGLWLLFTESLKFEGTAAPCPSDGIRVDCGKAGGTGTCSIAYKCSSGLIVFCATAHGVRSGATAISGSMPPAASLKVHPATVGG